HRAVRLRPRPPRLRPADAADDAGSDRDRGRHRGRLVGGGGRMMTQLRRPRWPLVAAIAFALVAAAFTYGWQTPSRYYALLAEPAPPAANVVHAPGGKPPADGTGFYFVDVNLLHANLIQKLWAEHLVDGADLVPDKEILTPGESNSQRVAQDM